MHNRPTFPDAVEQMKKVRQARLYLDQQVPNDIVQNLLDVARWTGSSRNTQPWHFIVITDPNQLRAISEIRAPIAWVADVSIAIAIVLEGNTLINEAFDEGRVSERLLIAARLLGLGGGTAWFGDDSQQARGREILGVPDHLVARSVVAIGYPRQFKDHRPNPSTPGRHPLDEIVSYGVYRAKSQQEPADE